jgi:hypothetical protein
MSINPLSILLLSVIRQPELKSNNEQKAENIFAVPQYCNTMLAVCCLLACKYLIPFKETN